MFRPLVLSILLLSTTSLTAFADNGDLHPRVEAGGKLGTERSLGTGEFWVPLSQGHDRVLYGDLRYMLDDQHNQEGNVGLGYRQIVDAPLAGQAIAGGHVWIDRRRSKSDNVFYQTAVGAELLARDWDVRANAYVPLSGDKDFTDVSANTQSSNPYLAGSGIYYDAGGQTATRFTEEPQPGFDLELGVRIPAFGDEVESIRVYGGGYHFIGDKTEDVSGWRTRLVADITPSFSVGGRFQRDDERGSQGFLEATIRFPFSAKKSFREEGLRARLDESPERDVDIVTAAKAVQSKTYGQTQIAIMSSATGNDQRVLHVDNTASAGGDGSKNRPFDTLKAAEAAMQAHDVIYVHAGDGTTTGQDEGIIIDQPGVSLIGSGTNFIYDGNKFTAASGADFSGTIIARKTISPVITSTIIDPTLNRSAGVWVAEGDTQVAGLKFSSSYYGVALYAPGKNIENVRFSDLELDGNTTGMDIRPDTGESIDGLHLSKISTSNNLTGVSFVNWGAIDNVTISDTFSDNENMGLYFLNFSSIGDVAITNAAANDIGVDAIYISNYGSMGDLSATGLVVTSSSGRGVNVYNNGAMEDFVVSNIQANDITEAIRLENSGTVDTISVSSLSGDRNGSSTLYLENDGTINGISISHVSANDNNSQGIYFENDGSIGDLSLSNVSANGASLYGFYFTNDGDIAGASMSSSVFSGNGFVGVNMANSATQNYLFDMSNGNSIYGNATYDIQLLNSGVGTGNVDAQNVWWGQPGGPLPGKIDVFGGGVLDISNPLGYDPNL